MEPNPLRILLTHRSTLRGLQSEKAYWSRFFRKFTAFLYKKNFYDQYVASVYKVIKAFFNYLHNDKCLPIGQFHKQFKLPSHTLSPIVLTPVQLRFLITDTGFHQSLPAHLQRSKDIFVFGSTVGLRYADLMGLKKQDIINTSGESIIKLHTQKTGTEVRIPLPGYAMDIINKYTTKTGKYVMPRLADSNLNLHIKAIAERAGWTYLLPKIRHRQGVAVEVKTRQNKCYRFCDHLSTHTMRRTAITTLLIMGVPETMVRRISGHADGSKEFYKYVAIVQDYMNEKVRDAYSKLIEPDTRL